MRNSWYALNRENLLKFLMSRHCFNSVFSISWNSRMNSVFLLFFFSILFSFKTQPRPFPLLPPEPEMTHVMMLHMGSDACRAVQAGRAPPTGTRRGSTCFYKHRRAISAKGRQLYANHFGYFFSHGWKQPDKTALTAWQVSMKYHFRSPFSGFVLNFMRWQSGWPTPRDPISPEKLFLRRNLHKNVHRYESNSV